jgi:hypothetical protein
VLSDFSVNKAVTARRMRSSLPDDMSRGQNRGFALGCFFLNRRKAQVRHVFAFHGAVGDCANHFGYLHLAYELNEGLGDTLNSKSSIVGSADKSSNNVP